MLLAAGIGLSSYIEVELSRLSIEPENDPSMQQAGIDMLLRSQGLEQPLAQMAVEVPSQRFDETTTLLRVQGDGATLRYL